MKIIFCGGGTMGPVTPLLTILKYLNEKKNIPLSNFLWVGTRKGPEKQVILENKVKFQAIFSGKLRRYFSFKNFTDIFALILGIFQSFWLILKFRPNAIVGAGGFVQVPVIIAGWFLAIPILIHQQDIRPSLANKLVSFFADKVTVNFFKSLLDFPAKKTVQTGNPVRQDLFNMNSEKARQKLNLSNNLPVFLVTGGGSGASFFNNFVWENLANLVSFCQVVHITGRDKMMDIQKRENYHQYEFLTAKMSAALIGADVVLARCGLATISELSVLGKPAVIIPLPNSHQEENAYILKENNAAIVLNQKDLNSLELLEKIRNLFQNKDEQKKLSQNIVKINLRDAILKISKEITNLASP